MYFRRPSPSFRPKLMSRNMFCVNDILVDDGFNGVQVELKMLPLFAGGNKTFQDQELQVYNFLGCCHRIVVDSGAELHAVPSAECLDNVRRTSNDGRPPCSRYRLSTSRSPAKPPQIGAVTSLLIKETIVCFSINALQERPRQRLKLAYQQTRMILHLWTILWMLVNPLLSPGAYLCSCQLLVQV